VGAAVLLRGDFKIAEERAFRYHARGSLARKNAEIGTATRRTCARAGS
jgi:hypothetical protein